MACAISIVIMLVGFISITTLPIEQYPDIAPPTVRVSTSYTGADANTIMKSVVQPLEESINGVPGMTYITSSASASGDVSIQVYFNQGIDPDKNNEQPAHDFRDHPRIQCGEVSSGMPGQRCQADAEGY